MLFCVASATNHDRFQERSLPALRTLKRYAAGATCKTGYATPLTSGVSMNASGVPDGLGVIGQPHEGQAAVGASVWPGNALEVQAVVIRPAVKEVCGGKNHGP